MPFVEHAVVELQLPEKIDFVTHSLVRGDDNVASLCSNERQEVQWRLLLRLRQLGEHHSPACSHGRLCLRCHGGELRLFCWSIVNWCLRSINRRSISGEHVATLGVVVVCYTLPSARYTGAESWPRPRSSCDRSCAYLSSSSAATEATRTGRATRGIPLSPTVLGWALTSSVACTTVVVWRRRSTTVACRSSIRL